MFTERCLPSILVLLVTVSLYGCASALTGVFLADTLIKSGRSIASLASFGSGNRDLIVSVSGDETEGAEFFVEMAVTSAEDERSVYTPCEGAERVEDVLCEAVVRASEGDEVVVNFTGPSDLQLRVAEGENLLCDINGGESCRRFVPTN